MKEASASMKVARVALDVPLATLFDYAVPAAAGDPLELLGRRVLVPFGRGRRIGVVLESGVEPAVPPARIKPLARVFRDEPPLAPDVLELLHFASDYYHHPLGQVALSVLPGRLRRVGGVDEGVEVFALTVQGAQLDPAETPARALTRRRLLGMLRNRGLVEASALRAVSPHAGRVLRELERAGLVRRSRAVPVPPQGVAGEAPAADGSGPSLSAHQAAAVQAVLARAEAFAPFLLRGVTGSGKTEVYLRIVAELLRRGRQALVLVPEINLTPQLTERFRARFAGVPLVALHSNLGEGERLRGWRAAECGEAGVVIGTRLAVFTPLPRLGIVVVDEEHDASFKQQEGLRYSARDLALLRAKLRGIPVLLGSATPSLESYAHAAAGRYALLELPERPGASPPLIRCIDTRGKRLAHGLAPPLLEALRARLVRGEQSLVFVNRRGYAPALVCPACAWAAPCTRCSAKLVLHLADGRLRCHYCGHEEPITAVCPACGNQDLAPAGHGTQRLEAVLQQALPGARVLRVDRDTTRRRHSFEAMQRRIHGQEVDILVGTQMLAKGHDFPRLTLVGVVNADSALYSSDFRAAERLYAQLTQVAGRAGRGDLPGEVLIQTDFPDHPLYDAVCRQDYAGFARAALEERREAGFPPHAYQALVRAEATRRDVVDAYLMRAAAAGMGLGLAVEVYDPVPPPIARVGGRERGQLLVQSRSRSELQRFLHAWYPHLTDKASRAVRWSLDVDPIEL
ncbi:MAG TPA: primosomal protein N' [Burkholderiales bacterium]|nr:primosomal protein N' [Burkholderiales bacterium]